MTLVASTGPVLVRCWQHNGMFMGELCQIRIQMDQKKSVGVDEYLNLTDSD